MHNINIYLCRHGQSEGNTVIPDVIGQPSSSPLTKTGIEQAKLLGKRFAKEGIKFDRCNSSSFIRAAETTRLVMSEIDHKDPLYVYNELVEYNPGTWRGKVRTEVFSDLDNVRKVAAGNMGFRFPDGDALHQVERRATTWLEEEIIYNEKILSIAEKQKQNFLVMSHGMTIRCILHYVMGFDTSFVWNINIENCQITHLVYGDRGFYLNSLNDIGHLKDLA
jgi:broad specificity phosphatase PhoE